MFNINIKTPKSETNHRTEDEKEAKEFLLDRIKKGSLSQMVIEITSGVAVTQVQN